MHILLAEFVHGDVIQCDVICEVIYIVRCLTEVQ